MEKSDDFAGGSAAPFGRLQVFEPKDFPYLNTGKSLVFVIARNGMVWGKRLDEQSANGDVELEIFWPSDDGCLLRLKVANHISTATIGCLNLDLSVEQRKKIRGILSQKEIIQYELGTLMVRSVYNIGDAGWRNLPQYQRMTEKCKLNFPWDNPCNIKVVDCSYDNKWQISRRTSWEFCYNDATFDFKFSSRDIYNNGKNTRVIGTHENPINFWDVSKHESGWDNGAAMIGKKFFAARLSGGKFDMSRVELRSNERINHSLRIMYGEYDFFEYFEVDDAVLVLEEETCSADFPELYWTLGIAQNKHVREMMRLASNNPDLFAPLIPKKYREGGKKT